MADRTYRRDRPERGRDWSGRQAEQFESDYSWRDDDQGFRQMGDSTYADQDHGQFDVGGQSYARNAYGRGAYGRDRHFGRDRDSSRREEGGRFGQTGEFAQGRHGHSAYADYGGRDFATFTANDFGGRDFAGSSRLGAYPGSGYARAFRGDPRAGVAPRLDYGEGEERGWFERAGDEVASWFGDEDAARRREQDHSGRGPSGYTRSDDRILEDVSDTLTRDWRVDATNVNVTVAGGEVTLDGTVGSRSQKRRAEDIADDVSGVKHVQNNLRVHEESAWDRNNTGSTAAGRAKAD